MFETLLNDVHQVVVSIMAVPWLLGGILAVLALFLLLKLCEDDHKWPPCCS